MKKFKKLIPLTLSMLFIFMISACDSNHKLAQTPVIGESISFNSTDGGSTVISWGAASDNITEAAALQYKLVMASSEDALDTTTEADALTDNNVVLDWTSSATSQSLSGLDAGTTYWFAVLVKDEDGNISMYSPRSVTTGAAVTTADDVWSGTVYAGVEAILPAVNILTNDSNNIGEDSELTIIEVKNFLNGTAVIDGTSIKFTADSEGSASFIYVVQAGEDTTARGEAIVTLTASSAPAVIASSDSVSVQQGSEVYILASNLLGNDTGNGLSVVSVGSPVKGTVVKSDSTITFTSTSVSGEPAQFEYTIEDENLTQATGIVYITVAPLAPVEAYVYSDIDAFNLKKTSFSPPTVLEIFNTWGRFDGNNFYTNRDSASGNAAAWQLLTDDVTGDGIGDERVSMPLNVAPYNGFVSPEQLENYTFEATLSSSNSDDDTIGLLIAFHRADGVNHTLSAVRTQGGNNPVQGWAVTYGKATNQYVYVIDAKSVGAVSGNWSGKSTRIKIVRTGNLIECYCTQWFADKSNPPGYDASSKITIDLADVRYPELNTFIGPQSYGYMTYSQPDSTYLDISFNGGLDASTLIYLTEKDSVENIWSGSEIWKYTDGSWSIDEDRTIQQELGYVRDATNPDTDKVFTIRTSAVEIK